MTVPSFGQVAVFAAVIALQVSLMVSYFRAEERNTTNIIINGVCLIVVLCLAYYRIRNRFRYPKIKTTK